MTKSTITRTWIAGLGVFVAGVVVALIGVFVMLAFGGTFTNVAGSSNYQFHPDLNSPFWAGIGVIVTGGVLVLIGSIVQLAAWVGALVGTYPFPDKTWFSVLVVGGVLGFVFPFAGFAAMLAYVIAAPDTSPNRPAAPPRAPLQQPGQPGPLAPTA